MHPQLEKLDLIRNVGRNECTALATLLRNTTQQLQTLNLYGNNIDDEGVEALTDALSEGGRKLVKLNLARNQLITIKGWRTLSTLLEIPDSNLEMLYPGGNNIVNEGALAFANSLRVNCKLKTLDLSECRGFTTAEGWLSFSKLLCDTTSINRTYLSNHTLEGLCVSFRDLSADLVISLVMNASSEDKRQIAIRKILLHHSHLNVQPFFEWEFKVLPLMITWLEKAASCTSDLGEKIKRTKLSITYDFVREFPMLFIEPVTRKDIEEFSALEKQLQGDQSKQAELEDVQKCKARAMRRLL